MYRIYRAFWDTLWPRSCYACPNALIFSEDILCSSCLDACLREVLPIQWPLPLLDSMHSWLSFDSEGVRHLMYAMKFGQAPQIGYRLGSLFAANHKAPNVDALVPAPLSWQRQWSRGYNQCDYIVQGLSHVWGLPIWHILRKAHRPPQATLNLNERKNNLQGAYQLKGRIPSHCRLQLWDDTLTTGSTLQAMAEVLFHGGAIEVHGATIARAD